jgi:hypothetical protein
VKTTFDTWTPENLIKFCCDANKDITRLNNQDCERLRVIQGLVLVIESLCENSIKDPIRIPEYREAKGLFE